MSVHGGLGLGLTIVKHLVEAHGGTIAADSPGEGQREPIDVLLAHITMPGEDGYAPIAKVRALDSPVKATVAAAALTSLTGDEDRHLALQAG